MHVQLEQDNAIKMQKIANATNRSVGELVNTFIRAVDNVKYFEEMKIEMKPDPSNQPNKKPKFIASRNWIQRF